MLCTTGFTHQETAQHDVFGDRQSREKIERLEDISELPAPETGQLTTREFLRALPGHQDVTARRRFEQPEDAQQCRLARARGSDQRDEFAGKDLQIDVLEIGVSASPRPKDFDRSWASITASRGTLPLFACTNQSCSVITCGCRGRCAVVGDQTDGVSGGHQANRKMRQPAHRGVVEALRLACEFPLWQPAL